MKIQASAGGAALFIFKLQTLGIPNNVSAHTSYEPLSRHRGRFCTDVLGGKKGKQKSPRLPVLSRRAKRERNGNISHTSINILPRFPWKSGSCGRMPDNVMGMRAARTSTQLRDYGQPPQRPLRGSGSRWDMFYFHFNGI